MIAAPVPAPPRSNAVAATPTTVFVSVRFIVAAGITHPHTGVASGDFAAVEHRKCRDRERDRHPTLAHDDHFGSTLLSLSVHSIKPKGAPAGSATTATWPP